MKKTILTLLLILAALPAVVSAADLSTWPATFQNNSLITPSMLNELRDTVNSKADRSEIAFGAWAESTSYAQYDIVANMGVLYACTVAHASTVLNEPGIGGVWETVWSVATGTADADLDAIAALSTLPWGRDLLTLSDASAARIALGLVIGTDVLAPTGDGSGLTGITTIESDPIFAAKETGYDNHVIDADKHPLSTSGTDSLTLPVARPNLILPGTLTAKSSTYELTTVLPASPVDNQRIVTDGAVLQVYAEQGTDVWGYIWCAACDSGAGQWVAEWNYTAMARLTSGTILIQPDTITDAMIDWGIGSNQISLDDIPDGLIRTLGGGSGGTGGYVALPTYSDDPCSTGQWSLDLTTSPERRYICVSTDTWGYEEITLTGWNNPAPTGSCTSTLTNTPVDTGTSVLLSSISNYQPVPNSLAGTACQTDLYLSSADGTNVHVEIWDAAGTAQIGPDSGTVAVSGSTPTKYTFTWAGTKPVLPAANFRLYVFKADDGHAALIYMGADVLGDGTGNDFMANTSNQWSKDAFFDIFEE
jgi:hypothetical protein